MLRPSIARKITRLRTARIAVRTYYHPIQQYSPLVSPPAGQLPPPLAVSRVYIPDPEPEVVEEVVESAEYATKLRLTRAAEDHSPELDEESLREFYTNLIAETSADAVASSTPLLEAPSAARLSPERRTQILEGLARRLQSAQIMVPTEDSQLELLSTHVAQEALEERIVGTLAQLTVPSSSKVGFSVKGKEREDFRPADIPVGLLSRAEWDALFETFMAKHDARSAEGVISVMMHHGVQPDETYIGRVMHLDAYAGRVDEVIRLTSGVLSVGGDIPATAHNAFIASLLIASPSSPRGAIQYLREYEKRGEPLPQVCYQKVIHHLVTPSSTTHTSSHTKATAWELFAHMRLHAHPIPDKAIYALMIRTCADARSPEPERARDLWTEMTQEGNKVNPTREEYDAIIRALCSTKNDYLEGFDLLRQMLSKHHDMVLAPFEEQPRKLWSPYVPTRETFAALLEGTKRAGDLDRTRWILSELIGLTGSSVEIGQAMKGPDEELMAGVFMTYAAWRPTISRRGLKSKTGTEGQAEEAEGESLLRADNLESITGEAVQSIDDQSSQRSTFHSPRSAADAIREATAIFDRVISDVLAKAQGETDFFEHPFTDVKIRTRLVNSYLSVYLEHAATTYAAYKAWRDTWSRAAQIDPTVQPNGWSYAMLLERLAAGRRKEETQDDKQIALQWGKRAWQMYVDWSAQMTPTREATGAEIILAESKGEAKPSSARQRWLIGLAPRQVEKCWKAAIKIYASTGHADTSLALVREFRKRFPPDDIAKAYIPLELFTMDSRITDVTKLAEPEVPPHLVFSDVDVLHQRMVRCEDWDGLGRLKFITKEYEHALYRRRANRAKNVGVAKEMEAYQAEQKQLDKAKAKARRSLPEPAEDEEMEDQWEDFGERRQTWSERVAA